MKYVLASIVAIVSFGVIASGAALGYALLVFTITQVHIDPATKADYLSGLLASENIKIGAHAFAAFVAGYLFSKIGKAPRIRPGAIFATVLAVLVALEQQTEEFPAMITGAVLSLALFGAWIGVTKAANNSLKVDGPDGPQP